MTASTDSATRASGARGLATALAALALVWLVLVLPNSLPRFAAPALLRLPLELPAIFILFALIRGHAALVLRGALAMLLTCALVLRLADIAAYEAFGRPFNIVLDAHLLRAVWDLLSGSVGTSGAVGAGMLALLAILLSAGLMFWAVRRIHLFTRPRRAPVLAVALMVLGTGAALHLAGRGLYDNTPAATVETTRHLATHLRIAARSLGDLRAFAEEAGNDPLAALPPDELFGTLRGKDVLVVFVESYGRSALEGACCAPRTAEALERFRQRLETSGFAARSAWLTSPIVGGQSWLAHATLLSGLRIDSQPRYNSLVLSERASLVRDFSRAGWRTVAVMPAISPAWPEGRYFGYDAIYDAGNLGYAGRPFNWVTMPDQFTLEAFRRLELERRDRTPVMAEIAMISSHAPWTPIPPVIGWDAIGDGTIFNTWSDSGDPPAVVWRDPARVRKQFSLSIEYVLDTLSSFIESWGNDDLVLLVLGDHQPAPLVTGLDATRDVPVHLIARDRAVLDAVASWNWNAGMTPGATAPVWPMQDMRAALGRAFTPLR